MPKYACHTINKHLSTLMFFISGVCVLVIDCNVLSASSKLYLVFIGNRIYILPFIVVSILHIITMLTLAEGDCYLTCKSPYSIKNLSPSFSYISRNSLFHNLSANIFYQSIRLSSCALFFSHFLTKHNGLTSVVTGLK